MTSNRQRMKSRPPLCLLSQRQEMPGQNDILRARRNIALARDCFFRIQNEGVGFLADSVGNEFEVMTQTAESAASYSSSEPRFKGRRNPLMLYYFKTPKSFGNAASESRSMIPTHTSAGLALLPSFTPI